MNKSYIFVTFFFFFFFFFFFAKTTGNKKNARGSSLRRDGNPGGPVADLNTPALAHARYGGTGTGPGPALRKLILNTADRCVPLTTTLSLSLAGRRIRSYFNNSAATGALSCILMISIQLRGVLDLLPQ